MSLFDMYRAPADGSAARGGGGGAPRRKVAHGTTRAAQLRASGHKLTCYLNQEVDRGRSTVVTLPTECDTIGEVIPLIQKRMGLDKRMLFASELFTVGGEEIRRYQQIVDAAKSDAPIIVGCGEPFDETRVPDALLEYHLNGDGRKGVKKVTRELNDKRKRQQGVKAQRVRDQGYGVSPEISAATMSREHQHQANVEKANAVRHRYMTGLVQRSEEQQRLMAAVQENIMHCKMEEEESRLAREVCMHARGTRVARAWHAHHGTLMARSWHALIARSHRTLMACSFRPRPRPPRSSSLHAHRVRRVHAQDYELDRMERLAEDRQQQQRDFNATKREELQRAKLLHDKVKADHDEAKEAKSEGGWLNLW